MKQQFTIAQRLNQCAEYIQSCIQNEDVPYSSTDGTKLHFVCEIHDRHHAKFISVIYNIDCNLSSEVLKYKETIIDDTAIKAMSQFPEFDIYPGNYGLQDLWLSNKYGIWIDE